MNKDRQDLGDYIFKCVKNSVVGLTQVQLDKIQEAIEYALGL